MKQKVIDFWIYGVSHWFRREWWNYLLTGGGKQGFSLTKLICRLRGHPYDVVWYTSAIEPDMHCINCDDDLA